MQFFLTTLDYKAEAAGLIIDREAQRMRLIPLRAPHGTSPGPKAATCEAFGHSRNATEVPHNTFKTYAT